jgi:hypothetical protein
MNLLMSGAGLAAIWRNRRRSMARVTLPTAMENPAGLAWRRALLAVVVLGSTVIASDATRDVPARYGKRHPGLEHSRLYPPIPNAPQQ